jgi:hypothetical protein
MKIGKKLAIVPKTNKSFWKKVKIAFYVHCRSTEKTVRCEGWPAVASRLCNDCTIGPMFSGRLLRMKNITADKTVPVPQFVSDRHKAIAET